MNLYLFINFKPLHEFMKYCLQQLHKGMATFYVNYQHIEE